MARKVDDWSRIKRDISTALQNHLVIDEHRPNKRHAHRQTTEQEAQAVVNLVAEALERLGWAGPNEDPTDVQARRELFARIASR